MLEISKNDPTNGFYGASDVIFTGRVRPIYTSDFNSATSQCDAIFQLKSQLVIAQVFTLHQRFSTSLAKLVQRIASKYSLKLINCSVIIVQNSKEIQSVRQITSSSSPSTRTYHRAIFAPTQVSFSWVSLGHLNETFQFQLPKLWASKLPSQSPDWCRLQGYQKKYFLRKNLIRH